MAKSEHLSDELRLRIVQEELARFNKIIAGRRKLLEAIGRL